ncbi:Alpha/Beta hydrolase protein [Durotheca rogersii]|uniref:Alpha/Beta hydrolase protein n=1 Tax=Durotheca rogersii TaxID=419775 RepID=UPI00221F12AB|nr:Alpha/Beta hydrolase protein [Durotheca rogersii]KAI5867647.1 Alpha/Beta hydrolase protein [Durotheca rogersii]
MHGGSFITGDGRQESISFLSSLLLKHTRAVAVFAPQYRLASRPLSQPFPAALQDTLTSYMYLVDTVGIAPENIILSGDSAGGNLVIGLLRYLSAHGKELGIPLPAAAVLISPWVAPSAIVGPELVVRSNPHFASDYLPFSLLRWGATAYAGNASVSDPYISPLGHAFATPVRTFVNVGTAELFEMDITRWAKEMERVEGNCIELNYEAGAPHDTLLMGHLLGWEASAEKVAMRIGSFLR